MSKKRNENMRKNMRKQMRKNIKENMRKNIDDPPTHLRNMSKICGKI